MQKNRVLDFAVIKQAIITSLTPDLLSKQYRHIITQDDPVEAGHCAIATEAFYHMAGGAEAGFMPVVCSYYESDKDRRIYAWNEQPILQAQGFTKFTHWWVRGPEGNARGKGKVFDVTKAQYPEGFDYTQGRNSGFMQPQRKASSRAQILIDRVKAKVGGDVLDNYRQNNIVAFQATQKPIPQSKRGIVRPGTHAFVA